MEDHSALLKQADAFNKKVKTTKQKQKKERRGISMNMFKKITMFFLLILNINNVLINRMLDVNSIGKAAEPLRHAFQQAFEVGWRFQANLNFSNAMSEFFDTKAVTWSFYLIFTVFGCVALPMLCYILVDGFQKSQRIRWDIIEMGGFALLSEIPYDLATSGKWMDYRSQNLFFGFFIGLLVLAALKKIAEKWPEAKYVRYGLNILVVAAGLVISMLGLSYYLCFPVLIMVLMYAFRSSKLMGSVAGCMTMMTMSTYYLCSMLSLIPIAAYNGKPGKKMGYVLYLFYPITLLVLYFIAKGMNLY